MRECLCCWNYSRWRTRLKRRRLVLQSIRISRQSLQLFRVANMCLTKSMMVDREYISATIDASGALGEPNLSENLEYWMTYLPPRLRSLPVNYLAIPGSHNSMTYTITRYSDIGPDEPKWIRWLGPMAKNVIFNWSINQHESVKEQLDGGIRYLDLRVASKPGDEKVYFLHGLYGAETSQPLQEVADWLSSHPNEAVIIDFQHFYGFVDAHHRYLINQIKDLFRGKMCPVSVNARFDHISLQQLNYDRHQVIVIYRNRVAINYNDLWPSGSWPTPWPNTIKPEKLVNFLNDGLQNRVRDFGYISQCLLTPDGTYIAKHFLGSLQVDLWPKYRAVTIQWVNEHSPGNDGMNIVIADYISFEDFLFPRMVIQRNAVLLRV